MQFTTTIWENPRTKTIKHSLIVYISVWVRVYMYMERDRCNFSNTCLCGHSMPAFFLLNKSLFLALWTWIVLVLIVKLLLWNMWLRCNLQWQKSKCIHSRLCHWKLQLSGSQHKNRRPKSLAVALSHMFWWHKTCTLNMVRSPCSASSKVKRLGKCIFFRNKAHEITAKAHLNVSCRRCELDQNIKTITEMNSTVLNYHLHFLYNAPQYCT